MSDFFALAKARQSCRNYASTPVEPEKLDRCIETALLSPSACNSQPWSFVTTNSPDISLKVAECLTGAAINKFTKTCPAFVVVIEESQNMSARFGAKLKSQDYSSVDIGIAATHIVFAAAQQNLSTCILGWFDEQKLMSLLSIPSSKRIRLVIAVGYAAQGDPQRPKVRKSITAVHKKDSYK